MPPRWQVYGNIIFIGICAALVFIATAFIILLLPIAANDGLIHLGKARKTITNKHFTLFSYAYIISIRKILHHISQGENIMQKLLQFMALASVALLLGACGSSSAEKTPAKEAAKPQPSEAIVYYTQDMSPAGIQRLYAKVNKNISDRVAIKFHRNHHYTETPQGVQLMQGLCTSIPNGTLVETTFGGGAKEGKEMQERFRKQGLTFAPIDVLNVDGAVTWPVPGGRLLKEAQVAKNLANYDSLVIYAPYRGDAYPGHGGALTNLGVGLQDGKNLVHGSPLNKKPEFFERMAEAGKAVTSHFGKKIAYLNVLDNVIVKCECYPKGSAPVNLGIMASEDPVAIDKAAMDLVLAKTQHKEHNKANRTGIMLALYQLEYMEKLGMGTQKYKLVEVK